MNRRISGALLALALAGIGCVFAASAGAGNPNLVTGPPTSNIVRIGACEANGGATVTAGQPFTVRMGGWDAGTYGVIRNVIPKDNSILTVERPVGNPIPASFSLQEPDEVSPNAWIVWRWSEVYTLAAGEQMSVTIQPSLSSPWLWVFPASYNPDDFGFPPYDGTGPVFGPLLIPAGPEDPIACTITGT